RLREMDDRRLVDVREAALLVEQLDRAELAAVECRQAHCEPAVEWAVEAQQPCERRGGRLGCELLGARAGRGARGQVRQLAGRTALEEEVARGRCDALRVARWSLAQSGDEDAVVDCREIDEAEPGGNGVAPERVRDAERRLAGLVEVGPERRRVLGAEVRDRRHASVPSSRTASTRASSLSSAWRSRIRSTICWGEPDVSGESAKPGSTPSVASSST